MVKDCFGPRGLWLGVWLGFCTFFAGCGCKRVGRFGFRGPSGLEESNDMDVAQGRFGRKCVRASMIRMRLEVSMVCQSPQPEIQGVVVIRLSYVEDEQC